MPNNICEKAKSKNPWGLLNLMKYFFYFVINCLIESSNSKHLPKTLLVDSYFTKQYQDTSSGSSSLFISSIKGVSVF